MLILGLLWWSWVAYAWLANQTHVDEGIVRIGMGISMAAMFMVALVIPEAFDDLPGGLDGPIVLAVCYFIVRFMHVVLYVVAAGDDRGLRRQVLRTSIAMFTGSSIIIAGAIIGGEFQLGFWIAGLLIDGVLTYATSVGGEWRLHSAAHWAERHGLVVILALGESIVAIGVGAAELAVSVPILIGAAFGISLSLCLWWLYFDVLALAAERELMASHGVQRTTLATDAYTYLHMLLIAGVVISALGVEEVLAHADQTEAFKIFGASALCGGTALYLFGHAAFWRRVGGVWKFARVITATLLVALVPITALLPPVAALGVVVSICFCLVVYETRYYSSERSVLRSQEA